jgi:hypothetical protein
LQGFFAAQGLHGLQGFLAAQGLHGFKMSFAAQGLQGLQGFLAAQGLQGLQPAAIWIGASAAWDIAVGSAIAEVAKVATLRATTVFLIIKASKSSFCRSLGNLRPGARKADIPPPGAAGTAYDNNGPSTVRARFTFPGFASTFRERRVASGPRKTGKTQNYPNLRSSRTNPRVQREDILSA